jgi:hypothetical protein
MAFKRTMLEKRSSPLSLCDFGEFLGGAFGVAFKGTGGG